MNSENMQRNKERAAEKSGMGQVERYECVATKIFSVLSIFTNTNIIP